MRPQDQPMRGAELPMADEAVMRAAAELVAKHGGRARQAAAERAEMLAKEGRWPEHALALRVLSAVEQRQEGGP